MKVKYVVRENGKFAVKEEKFLPALRTFDKEEEALKFLGEEFNKAEEKFEVQLQQENGEFRVYEIQESENVSTPESPVVQEATPEPVVTPETPPVPEEVTEVPETPPVQEEVLTAPEATPVPEVAPVPEEATPVLEEATPTQEEAAPSPEVVVATATPAPETEAVTSTAVQAAETNETMNVEEAKTDSATDAKAKFNIKDLWKNPEYRKWLYLGIAVFIEVAIIIAIIVLIAG